MSRKYLDEQFDGILLIDKPVGWTSHDVVNVLRKRFRQNKVGHAGTLDPNATGLLVMLIGKGTKLSDQLSGERKAYWGKVELGTATHSGDVDGDVIEECPWDHIKTSDVYALTDKFIGPQSQIPPMVSALKRDGVPLYRLARQGVQLELEARAITIYDLKIKNVALPHFEIIVDCSKGTYIRSLAVDMACELNTVGHLSGLRRLASGNFQISQTHKLDEVMTWEISTFTDHLIKLDTLSAKSEL